MPVCFGLLVVTLPVWFSTFQREAAGVAAHPAFPAPSVFEGDLRNAPGAFRRENAKPRRHCCLTTE
jgi:hypothetical protein